MYEIGARIGLVHKMEDEHWHYVLNHLAAYYGVQGHVVQKNNLVDSRMRWNQIGNVRHKAAVHTGIYLALTPFRWAAGLFKNKA